MNFSPIPNRLKRSELEKTYNTNLESREMIGHDTTPNLTPKLSYQDRLNMKRSSGSIDPVTVTFESSFQ